MNLVALPRSYVHFTISVGMCTLAVSAHPIGVVSVFTI